MATRGERGRYQSASRAKPRKESSAGASSSSFSEAQESGGSAEPAARRGAALAAQPAKPATAGAGRGKGRGGRPPAQKPQPQPAPAPAPPVAPVVQAPPPPPPAPAVAVAGAAAAAKAGGGGDSRSDSSEDEERRKERLAKEPTRPLFEDDTAITLPMELLNADLRCRVCLDIMRNATIVMDCLHRFCGECIETSLRLGQKQCPSCRMHCASRRSLRQDPNFDALIKVIYPNLREFEEKQEAYMTQVLQEHGPVPENARPRRGRKRRTSRDGGLEPLTDEDEDAAQSAEPEPEMDAEPKDEPKDDEHAHAEEATGAKPGRKPGKRAATTPGDAEDAGQGKQRKKQKQESTISIDLVLQRHPLTPATVPELSKKFLRTSRFITIGQLARYLDTKLQRPPSDTPAGEHWQLFVRSKGEWVALDEKRPLDWVYSQFWNQPSSVSLFYSLK